MVVCDHVVLMQLLFSVIRVCKGFLRSLVSTLHVVSFTISCPDTVPRVRVRLSDTVVHVRVRTLVTCLDVPVTVCLVDLCNDLMSAPRRIQ